MDQGTAGVSQLSLRKVSNVETIMFVSVINILSLFSRPGIKSDFCLILNTFCQMYDYVRHQKINK